MSVRLNSEEIASFLETSHTGIFTTLRRDGMPIALPVWFVAIDGRIYVATPAKTKKVARIRKDDRVSFLVETGERWAELKAVQLNGRARLVEDSDLLAKVATGLNEKYAAFRTRRSTMPKSAQKHYGGGQAVIEITPDERILSWDNAKLELRRAQG